MYEKSIFKKAIDFEKAKQLLGQIRQDRGYPSGYQALDDLSGGLVKDGITLIAGRPAMGKTSLVLNIVSRLSRQQDGTILMFSPNMRSNEVAIRFFSIGTALAATDLLDGSLSAEKLADKCAAFFHSRKCSIRIETLTAPSLEDIRWYSCQVPDLRLLVVNNMERICKPHELRDEKMPWDENYEPKDKVLRSLKALAKELSVPIICTTHLHRSLERRKNKRPHLRDLKKIGIPAELVDQIIFLYRDRYYNPEGEEGAEWIVAKVAQGSVGTVRLDWDYATGCFWESKKEE